MIIGVDEKLLNTNTQKKKKILVVEDSRLTSRVITDILNEYGYAVEATAAGEKAVQIACGNTPPDLILMDIELEGEMNGIESAQKILGYRDIPIVFLTANTSGEIFEKVKSVKGYGFVEKGTDKYALLSTVRMALKLHEANREANFYRQVVENSLNEIYVFHPETLKFIMVNRGARENLGYTMAELADMTPLDLKPEYKLKNYKKLIESIAEGKQKKIKFNTVHRRKDGSLYPVEVHLQQHVYGGGYVYVAVVFDLTEIKEMEAELQSREEQLENITRTARDAIIMSDEKGRTSFWNPAAEKLFGYTREEVTGKELHRLLVPPEEDYRQYWEALQLFQISGKSNDTGKTIEMKARHKNGNYLDVELSINALQHKDGWHSVAVVRDIRERKQLEEELRFLSVTDALTNVYNRRYFTKKLKEEIDRARRSGGKFSLIMLDTDHFKSINDRFGHNAGDRVLKNIAEMIQNRIRKTDYLARWGGEEFIILLPDTPVDEAAGLAEVLREELNCMDLPGVDRVTASFGVAGFRPEDTADTLLQRADDLMYEAKSAGRNCVRYRE